jgi:hypothetical protein
MKNRLLSQAIITRQHSGGGTMLAGAYVTHQHKCTTLTSICAGGCLMSPVCLCKINDPFLSSKTLSNKKVVNYKVPYFQNLSTGTIFIWVVASFDKVVVILFTKFNLLYSLKKLCERYIKFVKNVATTIPDEQMTKIKVVHLQKL